MKTKSGLGAAVPDETKYVEVPASALSAAALSGLVDEFITREGTDYGPREHSFEEKKASVMRLIASGAVVILYELESESTTLQRKELVGTF